MKSSSKMVESVIFNTEAPLMNYYDVPGKSITEVKRNLKQVRTEKALEFTGFTRSFFRWVREGPHFKTRMTTVIDVPRFDSRRQKIKEFGEALECHEMVHYNINKDLFEGAVEKIRSLLPCPYEECVKVMQDMISTQHVPHDELDKETKHGCSANKHCATIPMCK